jgi:hypothetical protein
MTPPPFRMDAPGLLGSDNDNDAMRPSSLLLVKYSDKFFPFFFHLVLN